MGKPFWRSVEYFFTGNYDADDGNNNIVAIGFGGEIHAKGGDDNITVGSIGAIVYTGSGNDTVQGGAAYLKIEDTSGNLSVKGAAGYAEINKREDGNVSFAGLAGGVTIDHSGNHGDVKYAGAAVSNNLIRKGLTGNVTFKGAGGYNRIWHETNQGNLYFAGAGAGNKLDRTWFNRYQGSRGDVTFDGVGAANSISSRVETGNISFKGAGVDNHIVRKGKEGNITFQGAGASNRIERIRQAEDIYSETRGDIRFEGIGGYNSIYSDVAHGNINFSGGGAYNKITRKGADNDFAGEGLENANADEIVLTSASLGGSWIQESQAVSGVKSTTEANTYLFAFADQTYTKISKVRLYNDPVTGKLGYYATSWYKEGNHLANLAEQQILSENGFVNINRDGAYTLSKLKIEHQQPVTIHAVEENLTEYEWITYGDGTNIDASDVSLSDAKMGGPSISTIGTMIDVQAVKSNSKPNTYIYASLQGKYTKIVVVELANDPKSGELKYRATPWYKTGDYRTNLANEDISAGNGYRHAGYSLSDLHYSVDSVRISSDQVADLDEYSEQALIKPFTNFGESSGDVRFNGVGGGNVIKSNVTHGNVYFNGVGIGNVILHSSKFGNTEFNGAGAANVIVKSGLEGDLTFRGVGLANVLVHQSKQGKMDVYAGGAVNVLVRIGDGQYLAHLLAYGNISVHKGNGASRVVMFGGYNTHTQIGNGNGTWVAAGGFNVMTQVGDGDITSVLVGGANVLTKIGDGDLTSGMIGGANIITHISGDEQSSDTTVVALGGLNVLTKKGKGNALAVMAGGGNVLTHIGDGSTTGVMIGGANVLTKVGNGDTTGIMLGLGNVLTHIGNGQTLGVMGAVGNVFTKVGDGTAIAAMVGATNIFTHVGDGDSWALMGGLGNVFTKIGNGNALALMVAKANVFTHIGNGTTVALMLAEGNIATKIGNGMTMAAMVGNANIFTHVGDGDTFAAMIGQANILTKVGNDLTAALMVGQANIYTHIGDGTSIGILAGEANIMTKVGDGTTLAAMFGKANIMTHVGDGLTGVLALGQANIVTKVGDGFMGVVAAAKANVVTHVGDGTTAAVLLGKGNILTKVGDGTTVGLLISDIGNIMTHVGDGMTIGIAKGKANIITKVGDGLGVNVAWGEANILTHVGDGDRYNFAKGKANIITKVGDGQEVSVVHGQANIITHIGDGDDYTGAWGDANIITKVGDGRNVVLAKGDANIVTQVGDGDSFNALWSKGNIVTKMGDGIQVTAAKGKANIVTTIGNGLSVTATYGDLNINTKVGDGISVNVAWGKYNVNTKVGDGLNVAVMKGTANANIQVGDGLGINASYAQHNVAIKIGNGDFYSLSVASSNTTSNKLSSLFDNIKQTVLGVAGSQGINFLVQGDDASTSASRKGRGAIATPEITKLNGFQMEEIAEIGSDLGDSMSGAVTDVETPDVAAMQSELAIDEDVESTENKNLIVNGDFEQGGNGWNGTHGIEASHSANAYGVDEKGHGALVSELDTYTNTSLSQDLSNLSDGEVISLSFDFTKRAGLSNNEGMDVIWNGNLVFSASGDETTWQQQTLKLTAKAGSNRIEFKGTGQNDGLGYVLDNVVAISEIPQQTNAVSEHAEQNEAAQNATADKERAEADSQRLKQEKSQQLAALSGSQSQLEATDQNALETNGQAEREALAAEQQEITKELTDMTKGLDALDGQANYQGESGDNWIDNFAGGILDNVQSKLDDAKLHSNEQLEKAAQQNKQNQLDVQNAVAKSEAGVAKGEENEVNAQQDTSDAKAKANSRKDDALVKQQEAQQAATKANADSNQAQQRGEQDSAAAQSKSSQAQENAKAAKQDKDDKPDREGAAGSGLSGKAYEAQAAAENTSNVDVYSEVTTDGRFSEGLTEQELEAIEGATLAVNRLAINARSHGSKSAASITEMFSNNGTKAIEATKTVNSQEVHRKEVQISGIQQDVMKAGITQILGDKIFDFKAGGKESDESSFHFSQGADLLDQLTKLIPEVGNVLITDGNKAKSKELLEGVCFALSARYMMEERVNGIGGGKAYMEWLKDSVHAYNDNQTSNKVDSGSTEQKLLNQYRRQNLGLAVKDLLSMQYSQSMDASTVAARDAANKKYSGKLKANGLTGANINDALSYGADGYESVMDKLRNPSKSAYMTFMSEGHAMSVVVHKKGNQKVWSFYDPNFGAKSFVQYDDFRGFMNNFHKGLLTKYKFQDSDEASQSFYVYFNKFEDGDISAYDGLWKQSREGEQGYVLRALKEQGKTFSLGNNATGRVVDFQDEQITMEVTTKQGRKMLLDVEGSNFKQAVDLVEKNIAQVLADPSTAKLSIKRNADIEQFESLGKEKSIVTEPAGQAGDSDSRKIHYTQPYIDDLLHYVAEAVPGGSTNRQDSYEQLKAHYSSEEIANKFAGLRGDARSHMITSMYSGLDNPYIKKAMSKAEAARLNGIGNCDEMTSLVVEKFLKDNKTGFAIVGVDTWDSVLPENKLNTGHVFIIAGLTERPSITGEIITANTDFEHFDIKANPGAFVIDPWAKQSYSLDDPKWKAKLSAIYNQAYEEDLIADGKSILSLEESNKIVANINIYVDQEGLSSEKSIGTMFDLKEKADAKHHFENAVISKIYSDDFIDNQKVNFMAYHGRNQNEASIVVLEDIHHQVAAGQNGINLLNKINSTDAGREVLNDLHSSGKKLVISFAEKDAFFDQYTNSQGKIVDNVAHLVLSTADIDTDPRVAATAIVDAAAKMTSANFDVNEFESQFAKKKVTLKPMFSVSKEPGYFDVNFDDVAAVSEVKKQAAVTGKRIGNSYQDILDKLAQFHETSPVGKRVIAQELESAISQYVAEHPSSGRNSALLHLQQSLENGESLLDESSNKDKNHSQQESLDGTARKANTQDVDSWDTVAVTSNDDGGETRFDGQLIIQTENDPAAAKAAANLAGKHPDSSVVVQLDTDGKYRVVYGDPEQLSGKLRWQVVGHGRDESDNNNTHLSGYNATELAAKLAQFNQDFSQAENISSKPEHISIVGCSLVSTDKQKGFAQGFITAMAENDIHIDVPARSSEVAVDGTGRKHTRDENDQWVTKLADNKVVLSWDEQGDVAVREEAVRNGIAEGDIDLSRVGQSESDVSVRGAIADNDDVFSAPEKRKKKSASSSSDDSAKSKKSDNKVSYSGNIQVNVGDGEFTALNWGTSNVAVKVGTGGFKSLTFGDNNVMVHIGNGDSKHSFDIGGYQALEGAQMFIGNRNVSFNMGRSNDLIVMMDKSIPTPPLVNPFDGAVRISGVLQDIAESGKGQDWLAAQDSQWTLAGAKKFVNDMSGLDQTSSVDYTRLVNLDSQNERSSRGLKSDTEAALNKKYNEWLSGNKSSDTSKMSRADKFRQNNEELAFNLAVGGRGADIQVTTGNWNFMFGDNIQSILDTNLGSLFGVMTQQFSASGKVQTTFTYNPQDLPRQLKNKLLGKLAGVGADTTLADIFAVDYTADGQIVARNGDAVDGVAILTEMVEVVAEFGGGQLKSFTDPSKLLDSLKSSLDMGKDGLTSFAESHGLKEKAPAEQDDKLAVSVNSDTDSQAKPATAGEVTEQEERPFGFNALNLPNLFTTIFSADKQSEMKSLVTNLKKNLTADLLNMKEKTFDFLRHSGHLQGDGDVNVSLGNYNFNWGGDGKDLGAYLGDNNNFWGGRGDDVYYATGTSNIFTGGEGNDVGVLMGRENMMFGGKGNDTAVVAGRINHVFMGDGNDQVFVFGEGGTIESGSGLDYVVTSGNYNSVQAGDDQDYVVTIGNHNLIDLGNGDDFSNVFGNYNKIDGKAGKDVIKLMGFHAVVNAGAGDDHLIAASISKFSELDGGEGNDLLVLGGYSNTFQGGAGIDSFMVSANVIENQVTDISKDDFIVFDKVNWNDLWLQRSGSDLQILINNKTDYSSDQAKFESLGSVTFSDYFADNRAELVISMDAKQESGVRDYVALSNGAVDNLVQAMSGFAPSAGNAGFMDSLDNSAQHKVALAWGNVNKGTGHIA
ncbi:MARTX multifunctional-autoprocessing repeats-in-toxin holotoxin RtxA [Moritella sp.]|uniref:MARTX multifunctional-autoprocessing repeats-in-toxin holotoxin RtxA n=1 Tax=Moritella sp. TaxID=78556 RepID=UPI0025DC5089|nr:MARTX multifunctional-autoprocessing repeats-in-toxin holotoxin RtxA [Moritella sp.]MCJ8349618.1 MARTX multifunctional-autoprocessing repeats-in-toxin holotoxin RtxA [Moritella sp.]